jgi:hypothetical protein
MRLQYAAQPVMHRLEIVRRELTMRGQWKVGGRHLSLPSGGNLKHFCTAGELQQA